jgi:Zn-dependent protease
MTAEHRPRYFLNLVLFLATVLTTTAQGALYVHGGLSITPIGDGWVYSLPLMTILVAHELGHYVAARLHGVPASLPFFIPLPPPIGLLGTMGAVITQEATSDRKKLIDIGAAGPLAGMVVAIPVLLIGLRLSPVIASTGIGTQQEGNSLLYALLKRAVTGEWLPGHGRDVNLHATAMAGWAGFLVTMLNLIPIGQLDGGHVATAYFGNGYRRVAAVLHKGLLLMAAVAFVIVYLRIRGDLAGYPAQLVRWLPARSAAGSTVFWLMWAGILHALRRVSGGEYHPPVEGGPLPRSRRVLFWVVCVTFLLTFMPVPLMLGPDTADVTGKAAPAAAP